MAYRGCGDTPSVTYDESMAAEGWVKQQNLGDRTTALLVVNNEHGNALRACRQQCQQSARAAQVRVITSLFLHFNFTAPSCFSCNQSIRLLV